MIDNAYNHQEQLKKIFAAEIERPENFWYTVANWINYEMKVEPTNWDKIQRVSVLNGEIIGYMEAGCDRGQMKVNHIAAIRFKKWSPVFVKDLLTFVDSLFTEQHFYKISFGVTNGNPAKKFYDKMIEKLGGRVVGVQKEEVLKIDGKRYDFTLYECLQTEYRRK